MSSGDIIKFLNSNGLEVGAFKHKIDSNLLENECINRFSDISWINIQIKGTKAIIRVSETLPQQEIVDRNTPCDIVAKKDGLIMSVATSAGTPLVKQKDVVQKGDLLVSGEITVKEDETGIVKDYVHARAEIWAKMYNEINFKVPFDYMEKQYTGEIKRGYAINIFNKTINLINGGNLFANYDRIIDRRQLKFGDSYPLPVILIVDEYREFTPVTKTRSIDQVKELAERMVTGRIVREFEIETDVIDKSMEFTESPDGLDVRALITNLERIDTIIPLDINIENEGD